MENLRTHRRTKESGKEELRKAGIPRHVLVYSGLIRGLERGNEEEEDVAGVLGDTCSSDGRLVDGEETPLSKEHSSRRISSLLA